MTRANKSEPGEPLGSVVVGGILHNVPASRVPLEEAIAEGAQLEKAIAELNTQLQARGATTVQVIEHHRAEIARLEEELKLERGPLASMIATKQARLDQVKQTIFKLAKAVMGGQKSMKISGIAGTILVERTPKMEVDPAHIGTLKKLLGDMLPAYFEVKEVAKPLSKAWELLSTLKGRKLSDFQAAVATSESGRVRFVTDPK